MQINSPQAGEPDQLNEDSSPEIPISAPSEPRPAVVRVDGVSKRYHGLKVLDGVSFESPAGQALALWGANGAGKTTLIKAILGLIEYEGKIQVMGLDTLREGKAARSYIGYVPQETVFYDMSVQATMLFYARLKMVNPSCIPALLTKLGLKEHARKPVPTLSGGLKQRLALAIALLSDPPVLLLDEPTASLDAQGRRDYLALLVTLRNEQKTIIFASHRLEEVETLADRVLVMETGQVTEEHTPADLRRLMIPEVELTLWVVEDQRSRTLAILKQEGLDAHLNGRGTVIVLIPTENKLQLLHTLAQQGIQVLDFEMEKGPLWN